MPNGIGDLPTTAAPQTSQTPWPDGVVARYLTVGGATVDVEARTTSAGEPYAVRSTCGGCTAEDVRDFETYRDPAYAHWGGSVEGDARAWAQEHAERCRAMPRPEVA